MIKMKQGTINMLKNSKLANMWSFTMINLNKIPNEEF